MEIDVPGIRTYRDLQQSATEARKGDEELGKTAFLELMIAQISNQDPLEPAKNEAFIAQLAQFSSVEGIQNLNESMDSLVSSLRSSMTMDAAGLVGRNVLIATNQTALNTRGGIGGSVSVPTAAADLTVDITNAEGHLIHQVSHGAAPRGEIRFNWDGLTENGDPAPQNYYRVNAYAEVDGVRQEFEVNLPDQIVSVSIQEGGLIANLAGGTSVPTAQIKEIQ